jgi:hypothetical protein
LPLTRIKVTNGALATPSLIFFSQQLTTGLLFCFNAGNKQVKTKMVLSTLLIVVLLAVYCLQLEKLYGARDTPSLFFNLPKLHTELLPSTFDVQVFVKPKGSVEGADLAYGGMISVFENPLKEACANCQNNTGRTIRGRVEISAAVEKAGWEVQDFLAVVRSAADASIQAVNLSDVIVLKLAGPGAAAMRAVEVAGSPAAARALVAEAAVFSLGPWSVTHTGVVEPAAGDIEPAAFQVENLSGDNAVVVLG